MIYFPRPFPDELLGSLVARACRETGLTHKALFLAINGTLGSYSSIFLPPYIKQLSELTEIDVEELVFFHSPFPYIANFMPTALAARLKNLVLSKSGLGDGSFHSLTQSVTAGVAYRRLCKLCIQDDISTFGTSYWHRSHMLPAVYYCLKHRQPLEETTIAVRNFGRIWSYCMPHEVEGARLESRLSNSALLEITHRSEVALANHADYQDNWIPLYRKLAEAKGYLRSTPFIAGWQLSTDLKDAYGSHFLTQAGCNYPTNRRNAWPALMVRLCTEVPFSPVKHILLHTFLNNSSAAIKPTNYTAPGKKPRDTEALDEELSKKVKVGLHKFQQRPHRLTLADFMSQCGCWSQFRHARKDFPKTARLVELFKLVSHQDDVN